MPSSGVVALLRYQRAHWPMVGWNVAVMYLVARRVLYEIINLVYFTYAIIFTINEYDEHVECLYERMFASTVYDK